MVSKNVHRVNMNVPKELLARLDKYAKENYQTRSSVMCQACDQYLSTKEMQKVFSSMTEVFESMKLSIDNNEPMSEEMLKKIEEFEKISKMFSGKL